jgi:hypothetical protein
LGPDHATIPAAGKEGAADIDDLELLSRKMKGEDMKCSRF